MFDVRMLLWHGLMNADGCRPVPPPVAAQKMLCINNAGSSFRAVLCGVLRAVQWCLMV
jgi:hypothetical protein